jgi:hypothetical protein
MRKKKYRVAFHEYETNDALGDEINKDIKCAEDELYNFHDIQIIETSETTKVLLIYWFYG